MLGTWEIILIVLAILLIFGGKKIPELMRGLGKGIRSFKDGMNGKDEEPENPKQEQKQEAEKKEKE
jgi:sec-independent protein translocase protein TatA